MSDQVLSVEVCQFLNQNFQWIIGGLFSLVIIIVTVTWRIASHRSKEKIEVLNYRISNLIESINDREVRFAEFSHIMTSRIDHFNDLIIKLNSKIPGKKIKLNRSVKKISRETDIRFQRTSSEESNPLTNFLHKEVESVDSQNSRDSTPNEYLLEDFPSLTNEKLNTKTFGHIIDENFAKYAGVIMRAIQILE